MEFSLLLLWFLIIIAYSLSPSSPSTASRLHSRLQFDPTLATHLYLFIIIICICMACGALDLKWLSFQQFLCYVNLLFAHIIVRAANTSSSVDWWIICCASECVAKRLLSLLCSFHSLRFDWYIEKSICPPWSMDLVEDAGRGVRMRNTRYTYKWTISRYIFCDSNV